MRKLDLRPTWFKTKGVMIFGILLIGVSSLGAEPAENTVVSPDNKITVVVNLNNRGEASYSVSHSGTLVISSSKLGLMRSDADFSKDLKLTSVSAIEKVNDLYTMLHGKRHNCHYEANRKVFHFKNSGGLNLDAVFQVSNDGLAFRYIFPDMSGEVKKIIRENTSFHFFRSTKAFIHPCPDSKTGWEMDQPSYEEHYEQGNEVGKTAPFSAGWIMPVLFNYGKYWVSLTETGLEKNYCASRLSQYSPDGEYSIQFPQATEGIPGEAVYPESTSPWTTPWRVLVIADNLATVMESTLGTDVATPAKYDVSGWLKPGHASWSWIILKDDYTTFDVQKKYIDYAAKMKWEYCLIDADWDTKIGYEKIKELADYGKTKNVGLLLWYNSAGSWNTVKYHPKDKLLTKTSRDAEFKKLHDMGVKGVKIDFFGGDGQSMIAYYQDILQDAARYQLAVNFHGSTYPRGWARTFPNLVSMEAVKGEEYVTFEQINADAQPNHCCMLPFTRNLFDPMDFTPVNFSGLPNIQRRTTGGFEAALAVLFLSGVQHYADTPEGMEKQPDFVKNYMASLPQTWDDVKFIDGYPGKNLVLARRKGQNWYIAGINGENIEKIFSFRLPFIKGSANGDLITDRAENNEFDHSNVNISATRPLQVKVKAYGGFVLKL